MPSSIKHLTVHEVAEHLWPGVALNQFLLWPPNLFALTSTLLDLGGNYRLTVSPPDDCTWPPIPNWSATIARLAKRWRAALQRTALYDAIDSDFQLIKKDNSDIRQMRRAIPKEIHAYFKRLVSGEIALGQFPPTVKTWKWMEAVVALHAVADEACTSLGGNPSRAGKLASEFETIAYERLCASGTLALVDPVRGRVLPKQHTPQVGIALRSLSHHLSFHKSSVPIAWQWSALWPDRVQTTNFTCLLLPWPLTIPGTAFAPVDNKHVLMDGNRFGFFGYTSATTPAFKKYVEDALIAAKTEVEKIDVLVLPELSVSKGDLYVLEHLLRDHSVGMYVAGAFAHPTGGDDSFGENAVLMRSLTGGAKGLQSNIAFHQAIEKELQHKHHRWQLDAQQVARYQLTTRLASSKCWWEAVRIRERRLRILDYCGAMTVCSLICEDLARQEPIADVVRSLGPSLVIAILMDGPQRRDRWSSRYAGVLAEDPGSSVLALTSLGMVNRWSSAFQSYAPTIALWHDPTSGPREIELPEGSRAAILCLRADAKEEWTADGRVVRPGKTRLVLEGVVPLRVPLGGPSPTS